MVTPLEMLAKTNRDIETTKGAMEFARLCQFVLAHKGKFSDAALAVQRSSREAGGPKLADIIKAGAGGGIGREQLKAATTAGTLSGSPLADYGLISAAFVNSLVSAGAFDFLVSSMVPLPFVGTGTVGAISVGASAFSLSEGSAKPITRLTIVNQQMNPLKGHAIIVITQELARSAFIGATQLIQTELKNATALVTDSAFISAITSGITPATSNGATGESIRSDIGGMLRSITTGQGSKLFLLVPSLVCKTWSMATNQKGQSAFEDLGPTGGEINQIVVVPTDGCPTGTAILLDSTGIGAAPGEVELQEMKDASLQFESAAPDSPPSATTSYVSLWQMNQVGLVVERFFCAVRLRSDAVASVFNANSWQGGNSPP